MTDAELEEYRDGIRAFNAGLVCQGTEMFRAGWDTGALMNHWFVWNLAELDKRANDARMQS